MTCALSNLKTVACLIATIAATTPLGAKDYGQQGTVFPVIEADLLQVIEARLAGLGSSGRLDALNQAFAKRSEAKVRRPTPVPGITPASVPRTWLFDPSIIIDHEIRDNKRNLISPAGRRVNPLDFIVVKSPMVFIDGDDERQMSWALAHYDDSAKLIMVAGAPLEAMTRYQRRFYFDQKGNLTTRFGITHTPAVVTQAGKAMKVSELVLEGKETRP